VAGERPAATAGGPGRLRDAWRALSANGRGAVFLLGVAVFFAVNSAIIKAMAAGGLHPFQITLARLAIGFLAILPFVWRAGLGSLRTRHPGIHVLRGIAGSIAMICGVAALAHVSLADFTAISFAQPLFLVILAVFVLGEVVGWRRWSATAAGFLGVLIMTRPGSGAFEPAALLALVMALGIAVAVVLVKRLPEGETQVSMLFYFSVTALVLCTPPALAVWRAPSGAEAVGLVLFGLTGIATQALMVAAYRSGEASFLAPFDYTRIVVAGLLGYLVFAEVPDLWTLAGAAVIVASTLYIARREARLGRPIVPREPAT
jgi:drug/metabolite transporter (DMT)-like permease